MKRKATFIRIISYLMCHKIQLFFVLALSLIGNLLALAGPRLSGTAINLIDEEIGRASCRERVYVLV